MGKFIYDTGRGLGWFFSLLKKQKTIGFLLLLPSFMVILSLLLHPGSNIDFYGYDSGWSRYFFRHLWRTVDGGTTGQPIPEQNLSITLIIIAMTFAGAYLFKSKDD